VTLRQKTLRIIGAIGTAVFLVAFIKSPSFPTPDKLLVLLTFIFMAFGQAWAMLKRLLPFVAILLVYESFRSVADQLNGHVNYSLAPHFDRLIFGNLPTIYLQSWLWHGTVSWYDYVFYLAYMLHFILPLGLALLIWKIRPEAYWRFVTTFLIVAFGGFVTFFLFPAAPPWLAAANSYIPNITRISSDVWSSLGLKDFPSFYNHISPNPVAAVPSLHAAWATLIAVFTYSLFGRRWALLAACYPALIFIGTVYQGEHYVFDVLAGILYALIGYMLAPQVVRAAEKAFGRLQKRLRRI
jgi:membrane-associated phospholipid phosphatase